MTLEDEQVRTIPIRLRNKLAGNEASFIAYFRRMMADSYRFGLREGCQPAPTTDNTRNPVRFFLIQNPILKGETTTLQSAEILVRLHFHPLNDAVTQDDSCYTPGRRS